MTDKNKTIVFNTLLAGISFGVCYVFIRYRHTIVRKIQTAMDFRNPLRYQHIEIVNNVEECQHVVAKLKKHCAEYNVLGFDCEWVTASGRRRPIALLQLATHQGLCALIRLCNLQRVPKDLKDILEDFSIVKVGVVPSNDAEYLYYDYGISVASTLDLRHLAKQINEKPEGLAKMSKTYLDKTLDKNWRISCSDWEAPILTEQQMKYAANDAHVAIEIFRILMKKSTFKGTNTTQIYEPFLDEKFDANYCGANKKERVLQKSTQIQKSQNRFLSTRSTPLYDNCFLQTPDGELLCTCERRKAEWYIKKSLGTVVSECPYTVRLNFEPAGRAVGEVGKFYKIPKENRCVVCGTDRMYIKKYVVPVEYRKQFPEIMKSHMSHDILLLCPSCHRKSNISDLQMRHKLAALCKAPFTQREGAIKVFEKPDLKKLKSAARALCNNKGNKIPCYRLEHLRKEVLSFYDPGTVITPELLQKASDITTYEVNEDYISHGQIVVDYFKNPKNGGLIALERIWRMHFLNAMQPKYLPKFWSIDHNAERLEIKAEEGRIGHNDLIAVGAIASYKTN